MRVIANRDSYFTDIVTREVTNIKAIYSGSVYTVTNKTFDPTPSQFIDDPNYYPNGVWYYELLEQIGIHVSTIFTELPEEMIEEEVELEHKLEKQ